LNIYKFLLLCTLSFAVISCNNASGPAGSSVTQSSLALNQRTEVFQGQTYKALSNDATIDVEYDASTGKKYVTLKAGSGAIINN
jgi:hypothetical protein